jgi:RNA polymerase sigma factor (sigma-70 family)
MSEDSENGKNPPPARPAPPDSSPSTPSLLAGLQPLVDRLFAESNRWPWGLTRQALEGALERSVRKQFCASPPTQQKIEEYLGALHLHDLVLAIACAEGDAQAWEHFVAAYRGYLRAAASALLHCSASDPAACELADSLFADLYGLREGKGSGASLFRYFHGRSSLKTWLRAVLAQRHVDAIRTARRFTELDAEDRGPHQSSLVPSVAPRSAGPADPHRERYVALFTRAITFAISLLDQRDVQRLRLYYSQAQTLAEIGRTLGEHESSVSRNLERIRRELRYKVEETLRKGPTPDNGAGPEPGLSEQQIALCLEYASEDASFDLDKLFQPSAKPAPKSVRPQP